MKRIGILIALLLYFLGNSYEVRADEPDKKDDYLQQWREELDFSEVDELLEGEWYQEERVAMTFSGLVDQLLVDGAEKFDYGLIVTWIQDMLLYEINMNRKILLEVVVLTIAFSILKNFSGAFQRAYISEISFFMVYGILAVLLLRSFAVYGELAGDALTKSVEFMKALVPTFCISMVFSAGVGTSAGFYQVAFLIIYFIQWLFLYLLLPVVQFYVVLVLFNHFFEDEKFENLTELVRVAINWGLNTAGMVVIGLNVVQGLLAPARDRLMSEGVQKAVIMIPGIGNAVNGVGELLLGSGILIKNCVGVAALIFLVALGIMPVLKILCISVLYKLAAVAVEPIADKRISGCLKGMAEGGALYLKLVLYCVALLFVTIALVTAASGLSV